MNTHTHYYKCALVFHTTHICIYIMFISVSMVAIFCNGFLLLFHIFIFYVENLFNVLQRLNGHHVLHIERLTAIVMLVTGEDSCTGSSWRFPELLNLSRVVDRRSPIDGGFQVIILNAWLWILVQSVPKTTSPMPQYSKNWHGLVKIA